MPREDVTLKPLLPVPAALIDYPVFAGQKEPVGQVQQWSIGPVCDCFSMQELSLNCCCANCCFPFTSVTWGNSLHYMGVGSTFATLSSAAAGIDYGDSGGGRAIQAAAQLNALFSGQQKRRELVRALGFFREGDEGLLLRCCCMPCVQCQEIDTVFSFYRDSLGYRDLRYGSCWRCQCTRWYSGMVGKAAGDFPNPMASLVPFPEQIYANESVGPNYEADDFPNGYFFDQGEPKARVGEPEPGSELPPSERPSKYPLLPGYMQPRQRGRK